MAKLLTFAITCSTIGDLLTQKFVARPDAMSPSIEVARSIRLARGEQDIEA